ncbi:AbrB/MazE/SpoVT family DNA-binding domain-containing protein [Rhodocyclus tenuis]|uniref:AbrB/MazE/SpoVT family DNA-binding domain-containing protein n=1 Tax=Rhodocyclus tenuis TaxID=1066 RepID=UPI0019045A39|nr:AbrB/MazE/SpoVT family DNA-binding domain-containing protein [Rhodocyclus tenuis]MBK1679097.1 AbrB/MazE/SpoVT family DNA-binding domain-containing protein [Rhodocyclus tenuis]
MFKLELTQIGDSVGLVLPKKMLARLNLKEGDSIYAIESPHGFRLCTASPEQAEQLEQAQEILKSHHAVLRELAK